MQENLPYMSDNYSQGASLTPDEPVIHSKFTCIGSNNNNNNNNNNNKIHILRGGLHH